MNATIPMHFEREEPGLLGPLVLAVFVHLLLFGVLFIGVRWQSRPPEPVSVELWSPPAPPPPEVRHEVQPAPKVEPRVEPPPKPEPKVEPPKPEIVVKEKPKPAPKPEPKPKPKPEPVKPPPPKPRDQEVQKRLREEMQRAQAQMKAEQERERIKDQLAREQVSLRQGALTAYTDKIREKIRRNILLPQDIKGNPEAIFDVVQLPTGEVLAPVRLRKSSGNRAYDAAVEHAILKSSPLPKPDKSELFSRELTLTFRPLDD